MALIGQRLTARAILTLPAPATGQKIYWDVGSTPGFGLRVTAAGYKSFVLNYRTRAGRERRLTIGSPPSWSLGAAREAAAQYRREIDRGEDPMADRNAERSAPTIADLCVRFVAEHDAAKRPSTAREHRGFIKTDVLPALGSHKVSAVTYSDVATLHRRITARAPIAANRCVAMLSAMFNLAIKWGMRAGNPCKGVPRNNEQKRERYLSPPELPALVAALAALADKQAANIFRLLLLTGCRRGEAMSAEWDQFDLDSGVWIKPAATTKQGKLHRISLNGAAVELLKAIHDEANRQNLPKSAYVFPASRRDGHRVEVRKAWSRVCKAAGITGLRPHDLRHSYASMLVNSGLSLPVIGALLGHTQASTTHRYSHLADGGLRDATERVGKMVTDANGVGNVVPLRAGDK